MIKPLGAGEVQLGAVPEPASMIALGAGLVAFARKRRK
ncbi:MAG: PEP-CTERM sorting domain-containing protein [Fimbriimonas sp.]